MTLPNVIEWRSVCVTPSPQTCAASVPARRQSPGQLRSPRLHPSQNESSLLPTNQIQFKRLRRTMQVRNTVILGTGCSGLTAAIYAARANLNPLVFEGHEPGGQLSLTTLVENFPGFPEGIQGPELIENMKKQAQRFGAEFIHRHIVDANMTFSPIHLNFGGGKIVETRTLIIASGASARWLNLPSEQALIGHGVSSCATCDGFFFSGKEVTVIGGGDSAMEEALFLTRFASKVTLINRTEKFRASKIMLDRA